MISRSYPDSEGCYKVKVQILNWSTADRSIEFKYARLYRRHWDGSEDPLQNTYPNPKLDPEEWTQNSCNSVSIGGPSTNQTTAVTTVGESNTKFDSNLSCTSETPMHTFSMIVNNNSSSSSSAKKQLLTQIPDFHFNSDISQDVWELQIFDESEEHVLNSERNAEIKMQQQLQSNQIQDRPGPGSMTKRANSGLSLLGPDGIPLDLEIPNSDTNQNENTTQQTAPRTPNRYSQQSKNANGVTVQAIQPICWLPICLGALEDLYRFPEGTESSSGQQQESQQMILNGTNVTGIMTGGSGGGGDSGSGTNNSSSSSDTNLEEIKKRPITWRGWLPLAFWQEQKSMEQRNETRTTRESAERFFLDCVANHFCSQNAGGGGGGLGGGGGGGVVYPKIDIRFSLVWYPESLEHQFLIKRLSADRQKYQLGTIDHIDYTHNLYVKWMQGEMQYQKEQSNINDNNNQEQQNQNNMHLIGTNLRIGSIGGGNLGSFNSTSLLSNTGVTGQQYSQAQQVSNIKTQQQTLKYNYSIPTSQNLWATNNQVNNQTSQYNTNQQYQQSNSMSQTQQQYSNGYNTNIGTYQQSAVGPCLTGSIQRYQLAAPTSTTTPNVYGMTPGPTLSNFASILTPGAVSNFGSSLNQQQNLHSRQYVQSQQQMIHNANNNSNQNLNQSQSQSLMGSNISNVNQGYNINSNTMGLSSSMAQGTITSGTTSLCQSNADLTDSQSQFTSSVNTTTQTNNSTYQTLQIPTHNSIHSMNIFGSSPMATLTPSGRFSSSNTIGLARSGSKQ